MKPSILPYIYSKDTSIPFTNSTLVEDMTLLYDGEYPIIYKNEFRNMKDMYDCNHEINHMESRINILDRIYFDNPEFINQYANTDDLKILYFDIETSSYMTFSNAQEDAIIAIGVAINEGPIELFMADTYDDDKKILNQFFEYIQKHDPDIIVTFNGIWFDVPYVCDRCVINGMSTSRFGRDNREVFNTDNKTFISGRIHYDIYKKSVSLDQNLFKFATNRKMKTVARHYNLPDVIEEDESTLSNMRAMVGTQQLYDYLYSDIQVTRGLSNIYLPTLITLAEDINVSLESCIDSSPSYISKVLFSREYHKRNIISDKTVAVAHPELLNKQGAIVGCYKPGLFLKNLRKFDYLSMYPTIMRTLNLGPETTKIVRTEPNLSPYAANMNNQILTLSIPDENLNKQIIIEIDFTQPGFISKSIGDLMTERADLKRQMKELPIDSQKWAALDTRQLAVKIANNTFSGYLGLSSAAFGSLASYIAITGTGRFLIQSVMDKLESVIAVDTDGAVLNSSENINDINKWLENFILDFYDIETNYMELEEEKFEAGYFRDAAKQYLLLENGKLITHGASFKASNLTPIFRTIINDIGLRMLKDDPDLESHIDQYYDSTQFTLANIKKNIKVKPVANYAKGNAIGKQLGIQYEKRFGTPIIHETQLGYVKIKSKRGSSYQLVTIFDSMDDIKKLDTEYYIEIVNSAIDRLGLTHMRPDQRAQMSIFDF